MYPSPPGTARHCKLAVDVCFTRVSAKHLARRLLDDSSFVMTDEKHFDWATMQAVLSMQGTASLALYEARSGSFACDMDESHCRRAISGSICDAVNRRSSRRGNVTTGTSVQAFYDAGNSMRACQRHFGFSSLTWQKARKRGQIAIRSARAAIEELAVQTGRPRKNIKRRRPCVRSSREPLRSLRTRGVAGQASYPADRPHQRPKT